MSFQYGSRKQAKVKTLALNINNMGQNRRIWTL